MAITKEEHIIDLETIKKGCQQLIDAAADFKTCATSLSSAANTCTAEALSVDNTSMQPTLTELHTTVSGIQGQIEGFAKDIVDAANNIYNQQWAELNEYRANQGNNS